MNHDRRRRSRCLLAAASMMLLLGFLVSPAWPRDLLRQLNEEITHHTFGTIDSVLVSQHGNLIYEEYYNRYDADRLHRLYSTTKSFASALVGMAIDRGALDGLDGRLLDFFPDYTPANLDERKEAITLRDVMKMQAGLMWDELSIPYGSPGNSGYEMNHSGRPRIEYMLDLPMVGAPGEVFAYNSGLHHLLSRILTEKLGTKASSFAADTLFADLGIDRFTWDGNSSGDTDTAAGLSLRPRDMLKFGELYLNNGYWQPDEQSPGKQVVPAEWIAESTQPYITEGMPGSEVVAPFNYGYQWWRFGDSDEVVKNLAVNDVYFTWGWAGQFIFVVPHLDTVIVSTASNGYDEFGFGEGFLPALSKFIFPAIDDRSDVTLASSLYAVIDDDSDSVFDDLGDLVVDKLPAQAGFVGEVDTESKNRIGRLVAKFALPEQGAVRVLKNATLRFFLTDFLGTPAGPVSLFHSVSDNDQELLASDFQETSYSDSGLDLVRPTDEAGQYYELDVTDLVRADYADDAATPLSAFRLQVTEAAFGEDDQGAVYHFAMAEDFLHSPELVLTFVPEPATWMILLACTASSSLALARERRD